MKSLLLIGAVLFSISGQAQVAVGDWATSISIKTNMTDANDRIQMTVIKTILDYNSVNQTALVRTEYLRSDGSNQSEQGWFTGTISPESGQDVVDSCSENKGQVEVSKTLAGPILACKFENPRWIVWFGGLPFGYVKYDSIQQGWSKEGKNVDFHVTSEISAWGRKK